jgi:hypothetical protein
MTLPDQSYADGVTIGIVSKDKQAHTIEQMELRHRGEHDTLVVFLPPGTARDARDRIWVALGEVPKQHPRDFEREQVMGYEGNLSRMFEGTDALASDDHRAEGS